MARNGKARKYKIKAISTSNGNTTTATYTMLPPQPTELTPNGYNIVYQNLTELGEATTTHFMTQLDLFLPKCGLNSTEVAQFKSSAEYDEPLCNNVWIYTTAIAVNNKWVVKSNIDYSSNRTPQQVTLNEGIRIYGYFSHVENGGFRNVVPFEYTLAANSSSAQSLELMQRDSTNFAIDSINFEFLQSNKTVTWGTTTFTVMGTPYSNTPYLVSFVGVTGSN
jgi:hypothetical protein